MNKALILGTCILIFLGINEGTLHYASAASTAKNMFFGGKTFDDIERIRLKGITDVYIVIEKVSASAQSLGISEDNLRTAVEIKIRKAGIKVYDKHSAVMFYANVAVSNPISGLYAVVVKIQVNDMVSLVRDPKQVFQTTIWDKETFGIAGQQKVKDVIKDSLDELVDKFILDYLKATQN